MSDEQMEPVEVDVTRMSFDVPGFRMDESMLGEPVGFKVPAADGTDHEYTGIIVAGSDDVMTVEFFA